MYKLYYIIFYNYAAVRVRKKYVCGPAVGDPDL